MEMNRKSLPDGIVMRIAPDGWSANRRYGIGTCDPRKEADPLKIERIHLSVPHLSGMEQTLVEEAFASNWLSTSGSQLRDFERELGERLGAPCLAVASGTAALHLAVRLAGVQPGDEVVLPSLCFVSCANTVKMEQGRPVLLDSESVSWNLDPDSLADFLAARARTNRLPKAVMVVHLFGQSADLHPIRQLCRRYELVLIEDAANAMGTQYRGQAVGTLGDVGIYSFNGNKIITSAGGGALTSPHPEWMEKALKWSTQARDSDPQGVNNYLHSELGYNYRMSNVLAGIARGQLEVLELRVQQRRAVFERYRQGFADLPGLEPQPEAPWGRHTRWLSCFLIDEAKFGMSAWDLVRLLDAANIESRPVWKPMHTQPLYRNFECVGGAVAEDLNRRGICLPSSSCLSEEEQQFVIDRVREAHERNG
jgi:pyridoxal phosphate-dependent aminotransferase EpsN